LNFIEPYEKFASTDEAYRKLIALAAFAWNAAILSESERKEFVDAMIDSIVSTAGEESRKDVEDVFEMLIKHKERYFANDRRLIADYRLTETKDGMHLSVAFAEKIEQTTE
jgi:hypothetical protein